MKYYIRRTESARVTYANKPVELDPKEFRNLDINPYRGNTPEEFLDYILGLRWDVEDGDFPEGLDFDTQQNLEKLFTDDMEEIYNSCSEADESCLELGEPNDRYSKQGGFDVIVRSDSN